MFIGKDIPRIDSLDKVLGRPIFAGDMVMEGMLYATILRSTRPHARIRRIDSEAAVRLEGVVKIITVRDVPGENLFGITKKDQPLPRRRPGLSHRPAYPRCGGRDGKDCQEGYVSDKDRL